MVSLIGEKIHTKKTPQGNFLAESSALDFFSTFFFCMEKIDYGVERWKLGCFENEKKKKLCDERFVLNKKKTVRIRGIACGCVSEKPSHVFVSEEKKCEKFIHDPH